MKKFTKMHVLALTLLASQQVMPSERQEDFLDRSVEEVIKAEPKKSYWTWENGKWVLAGAAALGAGALAYMYQDDIKAWVNSLTEQEALEHKAALLQDVMQDLEDIEQKQESIKNKEEKAVKDIAATQEEIAAKQEQVAKKQTMLEYLQAMFTASPLSEEDRLTAEEQAAWKKQNQDDRESDARQAFDNSDSSRNSETAQPSTTSTTRSEIYPADEQNTDQTPVSDVTNAETPAASVTTPEQASSSNPTTPKRKKTHAAQRTPDRPRASKSPWDR